MIPRGAVGADGRPAGFSYLWDDGITAADPGSGKLRISSANVTAATSMHINETDRLGVAIAAILNTWDDSTQPSNKGTIVVHDVAIPTNYVAYHVTGSVVDNGAYKTIPIAHVDHGGTMTDDAVLAVQFTRTGDKGDTGTAATIAIGTVTTGAPGASADVDNVGTSGAAILDFVLPRGDTGETGPAVGVEFTFDSSTGDADPGAGNLRIN
ncbi:MAG: hypothetical protein K0R70_2098, partial [Steroidobacteraceae bacterium]|nr:hypothetical protein [Steroidobacteraceae bacterium]